LPPEVNSRWRLAECLGDSSWLRRFGPTGASGCAAASSLDSPQARSSSRRRSALSQVGDAHVVTVGLTVVSIAILLFMGYATPRVPGPLVIAALGILAAALGGLSSMGVKLIRAVPQGLPIRAGRLSTTSPS
jgi:MFS superfamily sulfate permease-like transporter